MIKRYKCVVVANGLFPTGQQALELLRQAEFVVACDGAVIGLENGRLPDAVVGDLDSLPEPVRNRYSDRIHRVKDQETNDLTKAVNYVKTLGFREVLILGATGRREDHTLGNISLLAQYVTEFERVEMVSDFGGAKVILKEGGHYGDLYVRHLMRDENGKPLQNEKGEPIVSGDSMDELEYAGNMNAKVNMGWTNTFRYKDFSLSFLIDAKFGGKVISMTEAALDGWGVSKRSGEARDAGGITVDGVKFDADKYYRTTGNNNFNSPYAVENYVYDATNIRLREVTFGYTFRNLLGAGKNLTAAIIGRNLFFFHKDAPMDPDVSAGTGNGIQGVDMFALPTSRSFGLNLKLNF